MSSNWSPKIQTKHWDVHFLLHWSPKMHQIAQICTYIFKNFPGWHLLTPTTGEGFVPSPWRAATISLFQSFCGRWMGRFTSCMPFLEGKNREEGNGKPPRLFSLDMIPIDGCFEDVLQLWPLFFDANCRLPPVIDGCFKDVLQQWPLFFIVDCHLPSDGSHWPAVYSRIPEEALPVNWPIMS